MSYFEVSQYFTPEALRQTNPLAKKNDNIWIWQDEGIISYKSRYLIDYERICSSDPFLRLRVKTQVFAPQMYNQHNRTRLTHSLEVMNIAENIARGLRLNTELTRAIAVGHDLGHTPFGHAGERALSECLGSYGFKHSVQGLHLVRNHRYGLKDKDGKFFPGLNLTHDTAEGILKHSHKYVTAIKRFPEFEKYYPVEKLQSLEGQVVALADGVAHLKHDFEDATRRQLNNIPFIKVKTIADLWSKHIDYKFDPNFWTDLFVEDLIINNQNKLSINFSDAILNLYNILDDFFRENVLLSKEVQLQDEECREKIIKIFDYYKKHPDALWKKYIIGSILEKQARYIEKHYGFDQVLVDYIQWLSDDGADEECEKIDFENKNFL